MRNASDPRAGYTLVEILVVLVIITVLASVVGLQVMKHNGKGRMTAATMQIDILKAALKTYKLEQTRYPTQNQGLESLVQVPTQPPVPASYPKEGYLDSLRLPSDPWGNPYIYLVPGSRGEAFEVISYGADGEPGGEGEDADISSSDL